MLFAAFSLSAIFCTFFIARFLAAKTRLIEKDIDAAIARKLSKSPLNLELARLKDENGVLRNLLIDMLENEGSVAAPVTTTPAQQDRAMKAKIQRRREIFGEAVFALQAGPGRIAARSFKING
jgi:hypothetical protein